MTENEAKQKLESLHYKIIHTSYCNKVYESEIEALCMAKDCLKEIQQYRAIGRVEEVKYLIDSYNDMMHDFGDNMLALEQYKAIGTVEEFEQLLEYKAIGSVEEFKALKEKSVAKKPVTHKNTNRADCPWCGATVRGIKAPYGDWCSKCGQKLDWQ